MAHNPLLGNRISLISKKNIRYEGTLYSINEADATVALAEVRSYGTEGREKLDPNAAYVPPQDAVHPYLLFRGCDIKDLHVHERGTEESTPKPPPPPPDPAILSTQAPSEINAHRAPKPPPPPSSAVPQQLQQQPQPNVTPAAATTVDKAPPNDGETEIEKASATKTTRAVNDANSNGEYQGTKNRSRPTTPAKSHSSHNGTQSSNNEIRQKYDNRSDGPRYMNGYKNHSRSNSAHNKSPYNRRPRRHDNKIGTGASLLNRKARGAVEGGGKSYRISFCINNEWDINITLCFSSQVRNSRQGMTLTSNLPLPNLKKKPPSHLAPIRKITTVPQLTLILRMISLTPYPVTFWINKMVLITVYVVLQNVA